MRHIIHVENEAPAVWIDTDLTYTQVPGWCGNTTKDLKLSILRDQNREAAAKPLIVWIGGGGWSEMDHNAHLAELYPYAKAGFIVASLQYRTSNEAVFPAQLTDIKAGIRYLKANGGRYRIDAAHVGVMGESAGGHLAALAGATGETREFDRGGYMEQSSAVQAVCTWYAPVDLSAPGAVRQWSDLASSQSLLLGGDAVGQKELSDRANPILYMEKYVPPFLILHGSRDSTVPIAQSELLYEALCRKDVPADFYEIEGAEHASLEFYQPQIQKIVLEFFDRTLRSGEAYEPKKI